jgi:hypothetical protein
MGNPKKDDSPTCPAWMGTFADMMSLMLCFFVLLLSCCCPVAVLCGDGSQKVQTNCGIYGKGV